MKDHLLSLVASETKPGAKLNILREYLQASILASLQDSGAFSSLAFVGGTALRFLYGLRRFSEDLDFSLVEREESYNLERFTRKVMRDLERSGYVIDARVSTVRTVQTASVKLPGILRDAGLTNDARKKLTIRIDVDTRPPTGATTEQRLVTHHFPIAFRAYDLPSSMAGKLHALLSRGHTKGRDVYDLAWFLTQSPPKLGGQLHAKPLQLNLEFLCNALLQTRWSGAMPTAATWRSILVDKLAKLDWPAMVRDVEPFLEDPGDLRLLDREALIGELRRS